MNERILIADIDGVVSSIRNMIVGMEMDTVALKLIENLQKELGFKIVLSSSHRKHIKDINAWVADIKATYGVELIMHDEWRTVTGHSSRVDDWDQSIETERFWRAKNKRYAEPLTKDNTCFWRGWEIQEWLNDYKAKHGNLPDYVYIDDSRDLFPLNPSMFVHVEDGEETAMNVSHYDAIKAAFVRQNKTHD